MAHQLVGRSTRDVITNVERHTGRSLPEDWGSERSRAHREVFAKEPAPVPGVVGAAASLEERGYAISGSSGSHAAIRNSLQLTGLWDGFEGHFFSAEDVERGKPAPDLFLHAAAAMGYRPARITADMCVARPKLATASEPARRRAALSGAVCES